MLGVSIACSVNVILYDFDLYATCLWNSNCYIDITFFYEICVLPSISVSIVYIKTIGRQYYHNSNNYCKVVFMNRLDIIVLKMKNKIIYKSQKNFNQIISGISDSI